RHPARHHVRPAEPRRRGGGRDLERGGGGHRTAALHLRRPGRSDRRRERVRALQPQGVTAADSPEVVPPAAIAERPRPAICLNFRVYLTPARAVATYGASEKSCKGPFSGEGVVATLRRTAREAVSPFPAHPGTRT